jgi:hypothetical protein
VCDTHISEYMFLLCTEVHRINRADFCASWKTCLWNVSGQVRWLEKLINTASLTTRQANALLVSLSLARIIYQAISLPVERTTYLHRAPCSSCAALHLPWTSKRQWPRRCENEMQQHTCIHDYDTDCYVSIAQSRAMHQRFSCVNRLAFCNNVTLKICRSQRTPPVAGDLVLTYN